VKHIYCNLYVTGLLTVYYSLPLFSQFVLLAVLPKCNIELGVEIILPRYGMLRLKLFSLARFSALLTEGLGTPAFWRNKGMFCWDIL
jgi:hypothetical protein